MRALILSLALKWDTVKLSRAPRAGMGHCGKPRRYGYRFSSPKLFCVSAPFLRLASRSR